MKIAVVGAGISGLTSAYLLNREHDVTVYEANHYIGGHTNTIDVVTEKKNYAVDTGFIVFNERTYPNFVALLKKLGVKWQNSTMSFSVKCLKTGLEFSPSTLNSLFIQRRNAFRPGFYRMLFDAIRFRRKSLQLFRIDSGYKKTLFDFLHEGNYSHEFINHFIIPMGSAIWSSDPERFKDFPARYFAEFFQNHGILNVKNQPKWLVVKNGSRQYIGPLTKGFRNKIRLKRPVRKIRRHSDTVEIFTDCAETEVYDYVVIAAHSDQALKMLENPSEKEIDILGNIPYQKNETVLHTDQSILPTCKEAWASWNYHIPKRPLGSVAVTYDMNILQSLDSEKHFCVTLNMPDAISKNEMIRKIDYHHPVYTPESLAARKRYQEINGANRTCYCGAYWYYGFHEDGVRSALDAAEHFGLSRL